MPRPLILGLSGSLRRASFNTAILTTLGEALGERVDFHLFPLNDVPLYNQDTDTETPPAAVAALRQAIAESDGLVICSPEYNFGMSGVLKNALDWASRPYGRSTLTGKTVLLVTASPAATGGVRAHAQLNETLTSIAARIVLRPQAVITFAHQKIKDGRLADQAVLDFLLAGVDDLLRDIAQPRAADCQES